jgi:hypothetical protein
MNKLELSNEEKNVLLANKEGYQNVEKYSSIIGELYCYYHGERKTFYLNSHELDDIKSITHLSNSLYTLHLNDGTVSFFELIERKMLFYKSCETLLKGYYLVELEEEEEKKILRLEGMEESEGFKTCEDIGDGTYLITHQDGDKKFVKLDENGIIGSDWLDFESYGFLEKDIYLLNCKHKRKKFINLSNMTETDYLGFISYERLDNSLYSLTYDEDDDYKKILNSDNMLVSDKLYFEYHKDLGNGLLHLVNSSPDDGWEMFDKLLRIEDMKIPSLFLSYIDMGNGYYLLTDEGDEKIFLRVEDLEESEPLMFKTCSPDFLCTSIYGSTAKFDIETMTMGPWSFS